MERGERRRLLLCAVFCALVLLPFFLAAPAAHPATDDFTFAAYTHRTWLETGSLPHVLSDGVRYALRTWRDWQGTFTGIVVMTLNPAVFSLPHYGLHAVFLLIFQIAAVLAFCRHFYRRAGLDARALPFAAAALLTVRLVFLPEIAEGIYWFNGAWFYTGADAAALLLLTAADVFAENRGGRVGARRYAAGAFLAAAFFALGMDNYITAMMALSALFMMALQRFSANGGEEKRAAYVTAAFLAPLGLGLLLSVIAPGNRVRMAADGAHESGLRWLAASFLWTARDAAGYVLRFAFKTPAAALLLLSTPRLAGNLPAREKSGGVPPVFATLAGFYLILCAMIIPHMYSSGYAGSGRVVNMYHNYAVTALPIAWCLALRRLTDGQRQRLRTRRARACFAGLAAAAAVACLLGGQLRNYGKLVCDQLDGTQAAYVAQFKNEYALCEAAGPEEDVLLPAWRVQTVTGKPTAYPDPAVWTNVAMADYFGVRSVRSEAPAEE